MKNGTRRDLRGSLKAPIHPLQAVGSKGRTAGTGAVVLPGREDEEESPLGPVEPVAAIPVSRRARAKARARRGARRFPVEKVIAESGRWLDLIARGDKLTGAQKKRVIKETVKSFSTY